VADVCSGVGEGDGDGDGDGDGGAAEVGGAVVTSGVVGALVGLSCPAVGRLGGEMVTPWLAATLAIASLAAPLHPATRNAAANIPAVRRNRPLHLRWDIPVIVWLPHSAGLHSSWVRRRGWLRSVISASGRLM
jgi:hypothetical protein